MIAPRPVRLTPAYTPRVDQHLAPEARLARLVEDVATRLGPVCAAMPAGDFDALVWKIARTKLRWAMAE